MLNAVGIELRVGDLEIDNGVDLHRDVVLCDDGLRRVVEDLLLEADLLGHALNERDFEMDADLPDLAECAETLDDVGAGLLDDIDVADDDDQDQNDQDQKDDPFHSVAPFE